MIVRCGRCRSELEVAGAGEFLCPACGTRNVVRGPQGPSPLGRAGDPYGVSGLTVPGGMPPPRSQPSPDAGAVDWASCPACGYRFAMGPVERVTCPNCRAELDRAADGALRANG